MPRRRRAFAQEVQDEFLPELISDDPLDDKDEADEEGDAEVKECDAFIQQMEDQVKEFNRKTFDWLILHLQIHAQGPQLRAIVCGSNISLTLAVQWFEWAWEEDRQGLPQEVQKLEDYMGEETIKTNH